jgi:RHS repeat-associated protein
MTAVHRLSGLAFVVSAMSLLAWHSPAHAQAEANLPPLTDSQSPTGVGFKTGAFNVTGIVDLSIGGNGPAGLRLVRSYSSTHYAGWFNNTDASIVRNPYVYPPDEEPPPNPNLIPKIYTVLTGTGTSRFRGGASNFTPNSNNGETLTSAGGLFTFTDAQGTVYIYPSTGLFPTKLQSVTYPDGTRLDYTYSPKKLVISNRGYALLWESATKICIINMVEHYVSSSTTTCPVGVKTVTYTIGAGSFETGGGAIVSATNALGQTTTYTYVGWGHLNCIKDPGQSVCRITNVYNVCPPPDPWTPANRQLDQVISQTTATGETYTYNFGQYVDICNSYTGYGGGATMVGPGNAPTIVSTNGAGAIEEVTDPLGRSTSFVYSDIGELDPYTSTQLWAAYQHEQNAANFYRDSRGNVIEKRVLAKPGSGAADLVTTASYPVTCTNRKTCNKPDHIIDPRGNRTDYTWDPNHGGILTVTRPAGANGIRPQKRFTYTQLYAYIKNSSGSYGQAATPVWLLTGVSECMTQTSCTGTADEIKTTITYGTTGTANNLLPTIVTVAAGDNSISATTAASYDFAGNVIAVDGPLAGTADTTRTRYDSLRRVVGIVSPDPDGAGPLLHRAVRISFDTSGNPVKVESGNVNSQSDGDWAAFAPLESVDTVYDLMGRKVKESKSGGSTVFAVTQYKYDGSGRLECAAARMDPSQWNSQTNACVPQTTGANGPDRISKNVYNLAGERTILKLGFGTAAESDEGISAYTANGRLSTITDGEGNKTTFTYDGHDRLNKTNFPSPTTDGVSSSTDYEQLTFDANGNTTQLRLRDGQLINFSYDALNRMTLKDLPSSETDVMFSSYDLLGRLLSVSQNISITFTWDALGRQKTETTPLGTMTYNYNEAGARISANWPDGFYVTQDHFVTGEVKTIYRSGTFAIAQYSFDNRGNRIGLTRGNGASSSFTPDAISRLSALSFDLGGTSYDYSSSFTYNPANQISTYTRSNDNFAWGGHYNRNDTYAINGLNQATSAGSKSLGHDGRGNITSYGANAYTYSAENRMITGPGGATLQYDPLGRLYSISKSGTTTRFLYDGTDLVAEFNGASVLQRRFVHGPAADEPIVWYEGNGTGAPYYYHQDERGSVVAISDGAATPNAVKKYDEYGVPGGSTVGRFAYTGQTWLPEVGLYYYKARMYDPRLGRFMQSDPIGYGAGMNLYGYVGGDPVNLIDPLGLQDSDPDTYQRRYHFGSDGFLRYSSYDHLHRLANSRRERDAAILAEKCMEYPYVWEGGGITRLCTSATQCAIISETPLTDIAEEAFYSLVPGGRVVKMAERVEVAAGKGIGAATEVANVTAAGSRYTNLATNLTAREFQANLVSNGYRVVRQTTGSNGPVTILSNGEKSYTIYTATSTGSASAQVTNAAGDILSKIRLGDFE